VPAYPEYQVSPGQAPEQDASRQYKSVDQAAQWQPDKVDKGDAVKDQCGSAGVSAALRGGSFKCRNQVSVIEYRDHHQGKKSVPAP